MTEKSTGTRKRTQAESRKLARDNMAARLAAQRERDKLNEGDLVVFFEQDATLDDAADVLDKAVAKAHADFAAATATAQRAQGAALARMKERGLTNTDLAGLTELSPAEIAKRLKNAEPGSGTAQSAAKPARAKASADKAAPDTETPGDADAPAKAGGDTAIAS